MVLSFPNNQWNSVFGHVAAMTPAAAVIEHFRFHRPTEIPILYFHKEVRSELNTILQNRWLGSACRKDNELLYWPPRSPDLTP